MLLSTHPHYLLFQSQLLFCREIIILISSSATIFFLPRTWSGTVTVFIGLSSFLLTVSKTPTHPYASNQPTTSFRCLHPLMHGLLDRRGRYPGSHNFPTATFSCMLRFRHYVTDCLLAGSFNISTSALTHFTSHLWAWLFLGSGWWVW